MGTIIFIIVSVVLISATLYFSLKNKIHCPKCNNDKVIRTGKKEYKEEPVIALYGSPSSYYQLEYKCKNCGNLFWEKQKAVIFN